MSPFDKMKSREIAAFNHNHSETEKMLIEIRDKVHSENRPDSIKGLEDLKDLISEYISVLKNIMLTIHEQTHFEENEHFITRNKEYDQDAINTLETELEVIKDRIKRRETNQIEKLPKTFLTAYTPEQLKKLRKNLTEAGFIYNSITDADFIYIFKGNPITKEMKPIKWKLDRGKSALRTFITLLLPGETVHKPQVMGCFIDNKNKPFIISKPREDSAHYTTLKKIITDSIKL